MATAHGSVARLHPIVRGIVVGSAVARLVIVVSLPACPDADLPAATVADGRQMERGRRVLG